MSAGKPSVLAVIRHSPYGSSIARSALDIVLAAGAFEQPVAVLFYGAGVLQLMPNQHGEALGTKSLSKQLAALPLYDIDRIYAEADAMERYGIDSGQVPLPLEVLSAEDVHDLLAHHDHLLGL